MTPCLGVIPRTPLWTLRSISNRIVKTSSSGEGIKPRFYIDRIISWMFGVLNHEITGSFQERLRDLNLGPCSGTYGMGDLRDVQPLLDVLPPLSSAMLSG